MGLMGLVGLGVAEGQSLFFGLDYDRSLPVYAAAQQGLAEVVEQQALDGSLDGARTEVGVVALLGQQFHCRVLHLQGDAVLLEHLPDAVELQPEVADMARRSVELNHLQDRVRVHCMDMREAWRALGAGRCSLAVCNPPYGRSGAALESLSETKRISRHEGDLTPGDVARAAAMLLKNGGRFCAIYPAPRAYELMRAMDESGIAPKRLRTVHGVAGRAPKFLLLEGVKQGGEGLHWLPPLVLRNEDGTFTQEWHRIYKS